MKTIQEIVDYALTFNNRDFVIFTRKMLKMFYTKKEIDDFYKSLSNMYHEKWIPFSDNSLTSELKTFIFNSMKVGDIVKSEYHYFCVIKIIENKYIWGMILNKNVIEEYTLDQNLDWDGTIYIYWKTNWSKQNEKY